MICASCKGKGAVLTLIPPVSTCNNCDGSGGFLRTLAAQLMASPLLFVGQGDFLCFERFRGLILGIA
jgi:hypothetical protein